MYEEPIKSPYSDEEPEKDLHQIGLDAEAELIKFSMNLDNEFTEKIKEVIKSVLASRDIPMDYSHTASFIEGVRFAISFATDETKIKEITMFALGALKTRETLKNNERIINQDTSSTS